MPCIGVVRGCPRRSAVAVADAAAAAGFTVLEFTVEGPEGIDALAAVSARDDMCIGAGTVRTVELAGASAGAGARYLVSPSLNVDVVREAHRRELSLVPGVTTPSEIDSASRILNELGRPAMVKLFPAGPLGPDYLAAVRDPLPEVSFICNGGLSSANARSFLDAGALAVGVGGSVFRREWMESGDAGAMKELQAAGTEFLTSLTN